MRHVMRTLIIGAGALGGLAGARLAATGAHVRYAVRDDAAAARLKAAGFQISGVGGPVAVPADDVAPLADYPAGLDFDLVVLATKAQEAMEIAPRAAGWLAPGATLLSIQNGAVSRLLADCLGSDRVLGGLSNLGATLHAPGRIRAAQRGTPPRG